MQRTGAGPEPPLFRPGDREGLISDVRPGRPPQATVLATLLAVAVTGFTGCSGKMTRVMSELAGRPPPGGDTVTKSFGAWETSRQEGTRGRVFAIARTEALSDGATELSVSCWSSGAVLIALAGSFRKAPDGLGWDLDWKVDDGQTHHELGTVTDAGDAMGITTMPESFSEMASAMRSGRRLIVIVRARNGSSPAGEYTFSLRGFDRAIRSLGVCP